MTHQLTITLEAKEGAMIRTLGTIARRGWEIIAMQSARDAEGVRLQAEVQPVRHGRPLPIDVLVRQIERLFDVRGASTQVVLAREEVVRC